MRARTDEHGVARFRHVRPFQREDAPEPCGVTVSALLTSRPELAFDALMELPPRVELVLPPCGAVDVTVVDQGGSVVAASGAFDATVVSDDFFTSHFSTVRERAARGAFRLAPVEVGARFEVVAWFEGMQESAKGTLDGPTRDGEVVAATLRLQALPAAVFRAVDERGQVLVQQRLRVVMRDLLGDWDEGSPLGYSEFVTDDAGRFRGPYDSSDSDSDQEPRRTIELFTTRASDGVELYFHTEFDTQPPGEDRERGDAIFLPAQRIVAGRVVDPLGVAVEGAIVRLYVPVSIENETANPRKRDFDAVRHPAWLVSDAQGAFEARGVLDSPRVRVIANAGTPCESPMTEVQLGAGDVVLTVPRQGGLEGSIVLPDGVLAHEVSCRWSAPGGPNANAAVSQTQAREASEPGLARFSFDDLPAGRGELAVVLGSQPIVRIADLELQPGAPTRDPRVQRIDMRALMRVLEVRVESPDGSLAPDGVVQTCPSSAPESRSMWSIRRGTARCLVGIEPVDLWIAIVGARRERVTGVVANACTVRMRPPYELELTFRTPEVPSGLLAALEMRGEPQVTCNTSTPVPDGASMRFQPAATGRARVRLMRQPDPATGRELRTLGEWSFEVADLDELQTFAFALDPTAVEAASR
ncbi:MAG: hypothetical protein IT453_15070 [Planctomycetes bacterium]|nr:hypothetical protein [Planctomycetota bacterium]